MLTYANLNLGVKKFPLFNLVKSFYTTDASKKKTINKSFLLDFGYVESVGSVLL